MAEEVNIPDPERLLQYMKEMEACAPLFKETYDNSRGKRREIALESLNRMEEILSTMDCTSRSYWRMIAQRNRHILVLEAIEREERDSKESRK